MKRHPTSSINDDIHLFRETVGKIRRTHTVPLPPSAPKPSPQRRIIAPEDLWEVAADPTILNPCTHLSYLREGYPKCLLHRLKKGRFRIQDELDLHHMNTNTAKTSMTTFLNEASREALRYVRIIHGKGLNSKSGGPILKVLTHRLLCQRSDVLAFVSATPRQGGTGAVVILLDG